MLSFGVIGTSPISHQFIDAAHESKQYRLQAIYSRTKEKAEDFAQNYQNTHLYTDWYAFLQADINVIYIASPNSLHFQHAKEALLAGKHVVIEKPMVSTPNELCCLRKIAKEKQVFVFEAARNYHEKAFAIVRQFLANQTILGATFSYAKYSSKMAEFLAGGKPNVFSSDFSGGALMDLGIYTLYAAIGLLGKPQSARYSAHQLANSVDLNGSGQLIYENFLVTISTGKNITSNLASEIYTSQGTLTLNSCQEIHTAIFTQHDGQIFQLEIPPIPKNNMLEEVEAFAHVIKDKHTSLANQWLDQAEIVHKTLYSMRQDAQIHFKADTYEN